MVFGAFDSYPSKARNLAMKFTVFGTILRSSMDWRDDGLIGKHPDGLLLLPPAVAMSLVRHAFETSTCVGRGPRLAGRPATK